MLTKSYDLSFRLLRQWLCSPLCSIDAIAKRQEAVSALMKMTDECDQVRKILKDLPDLERLFMK
jgi:DNA mismatch repair protein MSH6